jgi:negative regulator of genetic competence, sporulation and motility
MELIVISSSKLKIMLSPDDMFRYDLGADIDYADSRTRKAFKSILEEAREKTGFDAESEKIFIQLYPSKKGGCEVYITKIEDENEDHTGTSAKRQEEKSSSKSSERGLGVIQPARKKYYKERKKAYSFRSLNLVIAVCKRLLGMGWRGESAVFAGDDGAFYLTLKDKYYADPSKIDRLSFICEYGDSEYYDTVSKYVDEHAKCICKSSAVETLGVL